MEFLDNRTPQDHFYNINALIISGMSTNKAELFKVNGYGAIAHNDETENNVYIVLFKSVPGTLQEDVESARNKLASDELVCNSIYTSPVQHK